MAGQRLSWTFGLSSSHLYFLLLTALFCPLSHSVIRMTLWKRQGSDYDLYLTGEEEETPWAKVTFQDSFQAPLSFTPPRYTSMKLWLSFRSFRKKIHSHWLYSPGGQPVESSTEILRTLLRISTPFFPPPPHGRRRKGLLLEPLITGLFYLYGNKGLPKPICAPRSGTVLGTGLCFPKPVVLDDFSFQLQGWIFTPRSRGLMGITVHPSIILATPLRNSSMAGKVGINRKWFVSYRHVLSHGSVYSTKQSIFFSSRVSKLWLTAKSGACHLFL